MGLSQVGTIPPRSKRLHITLGAAPSAKSTTPDTSAMAPLECAAASRDGATSSVAPQHAPVAADTLEVQSRWRWRSRRRKLGDPSRLGPEFYLSLALRRIVLLPGQPSALLQRPWPHCPVYHWK